MGETSGSSRLSLFFSLPPGHMEDYEQRTLLPQREQRIHVGSHHDTLR